MTQIYSVPISSIFTREVMEALIIIGQYRQIVQRNTDMTEKERARGLRNIWWASGIATAIAVAVIIAVAIPLGVLGNKLDEKVKDIIEGVSKIVASLCIAQLSLKIPTWYVFVCVK